jgi:hypothetical protein
MVAKQEILALVERLEKGQNVPLTPLSGSSGVYVGVRKGKIFLTKRPQDDRIEKPKAEG